MFRCEQCKKVTKPNEKCHKKVVETREKVYHYKDKYGTEQTATGTEIVKEINICEKCYESEEKENE